MDGRRPPFGHAPAVCPEAVIKSRLLAQPPWEGFLSRDPVGRLRSLPDGKQIEQKSAKVREISHFYVLMGW